MLNQGNVGDTRCG